MSKKILTDSMLPERIQDITERPSGGFVKTTMPPMGALGYVEKFGTCEEINELVAKIQSRRAKLPKVVYLICDSCGYKIRLPFGDRDIRDLGKEYCLRCNIRRYVDGGVFREMTKKEAAQFEKDEAAKVKKDVERMTRAALFNKNQERQKQGLEPLGMKEFQEGRKRAWTNQLQASRGGKK